MPDQPTVVVVGAGFAGIYAARALRDAPVRVLLIDQHSYHTFQPLLYQVATAQLEPEQIARTLRGTFRTQENLRFRQGTVVSVDLEGRTLRLRDGEEIDFDYVLIGTGAIYNDFGISGVREHSLFLKSLTEAVHIRSHLLRVFERVAAQPSLLGEGALNFVIVGGGPTGVEMAGALVELFRRVLPRDFPEVEVAKSRVILLEMAGALLLPYSPAMQRYAERVLRERGVEIWLDTAVKEVRGDAVVLGDDTTIPTRTVIWAAGVRGHPLVEALGTELERGYRVKVEGNLSLPGYPYAFVAGDAAGGAGPDGRPYPQVAQVAIQQGKHAAREILRLQQGAEPLPFAYRDPGSMAIIGRNSGVAELSRRFGNLSLTGFPGWLGWLFIHLIYLPGYRNRFNALFDWAYSYVTYDRHARLIADMVPSPAEIANRTGRLVDDTELARERERVLGDDGV